MLTGCDSGLGYSLAVHCQRQGARVVAGVLQHDGPGAGELFRKGVRVLPLDVTSKSSIASFTQEIEKILDSGDLSAYDFFSYLRKIKS